MNTSTLPHGVQTAPGYYPDPEHPSGPKRHWNGNQWTNSWQEGKSGKSPVIGGWIATILLFPLGLVMGPIAYLKGEKKHGVGMLGVGLASVIALAIFLGGGGESGSSLAEIERTMEMEVGKSNFGSEYSQVTCVERSDDKYRCVGDFTASLTFVKKQMGSVYTDNLSARDWQVLIEQSSGPSAFDVAVDPESGRFIFEPA